MTVAIAAWTRDFKARNNYQCDECGGLIPRGTVYHRVVMRYGEEGSRPGDRKAGYLRSRRTHLDCDAKWWQPASTHRFKALGKLPTHLPLPGVMRGDPHGILITLTDPRPERGQLMLNLPDEVGWRLILATIGQRDAALTEIQTAFDLLLTAITAAAGNPRRALMLSRVLAELQLVAAPEPPWVRARSTRK